ncbi:aminotransferase, class V [Necator americanus]|uniref:Aminotransferase, class V n=1 Tax=Necator americanus TaxID=51031 RepID=W2T3J4_NECAM|nr:aminotransferase, class V [Necator americanus]ETN76473.1 aminotransferase, class V [Necator americanus]
MQRLFGERVPEIEGINSFAGASPTSIDLLPWIKDNEIGHNAVIETPFGQRQAIYCDYTASSRAIRSIEEYIVDNVLPLYGNTHSSVTVTSEQTTLFVHEARQEIRAMTGAGDEDVVIFTGTGSTAAVELLTHLMQPENLIVIHSIHEHHSNLLPWRSVAEACYCVNEADDGTIDIDDLSRILAEARSDYPQSELLAAFTACSNITGICMDVQKITAIVKKYNALCVWDYASAAPYVKINVNGAQPLDAVFFSGHKFIGGVSTPGVLVVKKSLIRTTRPKRIGGGTVFFVSQSGEWYLKDCEYREEGGTPDSIGIIRLALAVKLKRAVGEDTVAKLEEQNSERFLRSLKNLRNVVLLGSSTVKNRLSVFSFLVKDVPSGLFFHHNYIAALLNDLFGIQSRAGCMCAGPYAQYLMGIDEQLAMEYLEALRESEGLDRTHLRRIGEYSPHEVLRPGFTRVSIPYFWTNEQVSYHSKNTADPVPSDRLIAEGHRLADENLEMLERVAERTREIPVNYPKVPFQPRFYSNVFEREEDDFKPDTETLLTDHVKITNGHADHELPEEQISLENEKELNFNDHCEPCELFNSGDCSILAETPQCILDQEDRERGGTDNTEADDELKCTKVIEDWDKRVIVRRRELLPSEEMKLRWHKPPLEMYKRVTEAIHGLDMIKEGDKILVCLSGGKDSLSLLHILHFYQSRCRKNKSTNFELGAITVDPGSSAYNPRPLIEYCRSLNIDYFYEEQDIISSAKRQKNLRSICAFCSRLKRGRLATAAQHHGWNVLAMGQHLDDVAESFFIAAFQNGNLSTMKAQYQTRDGTLRVIRPLIFVREQALREFASSRGLPVVAENCPACFNQATERHRIKQLLAQQELIFPDLFNSLRSALRPLLLVDSARTDEMRALSIQNIMKFNKGKAK